MPACEQLLDVLPALLVPRAGGVGVGELVDEHDVRAAREDRVEVHLGEGRAAVADPRAGNDSRPADERLGVRPAVGLDVAR